MPGPVVFKLHHENIGRILRGEGDPRLEARLKSMGDAIAAQARAEAGLPNEAIVVVVDRGSKRLRCAVITATADAMVAEATNRTLTRAVDAARGQ